MLRHLPALELRRSFPPEPVRLPVPDEETLRAILEEGGAAARPLDCGMCGFSTCDEFAVSIFRGETTWEACIPLHSRRLSDEVEDLEDSATLDPLTGLWNRRIFGQRLDEEFARHERYGGQLALLMVDVDDFKDVNDTYGHLSGDSVLVAVAAMIRSTLRTTDLPARYGGDEFAIVLPQTGKTEAFAVAEKLRLILEETAIPVGGEGDARRVSVSVSVGVASAGRATSEPVDLLEAADRALYRAKENGRNQVRLAPG
jgi:diguanylate cyclase (GGDEF)-like protein